MMPTFLVAVIVSVTLNWPDVWTGEDGVNVYREIAGTYEQVGQVGPDATTFTETFTASEGAQLPYKVQAFNASEVSPFSNEWVGVVPVTEPCRTKGKSGKCR